MMKIFVAVMGTFMILILSGSDLAYILMVFFIQFVVYECRYL